MEKWKSPTLWRAWLRQLLMRRNSCGVPNWPTVETVGYFRAPLRDEFRFSGQSKRQGSRRNLKSARKAGHHSGNTQAAPFCLISAHVPRGAPQANAEIRGHLATSHAACGQSSNFPQNRPRKSAVTPASFRARASCFRVFCRLSLVMKTSSLPCRRLNSTTSSMSCGNSSRKADASTSRAASIRAKRKDRQLSNRYGSSQK